MNSRNNDGEKTEADGLEAEKKTVEEAKMGGLAELIKLKRGRGEIEIGIKDNKKFKIQKEGAEGDREEKVWTINRHAAKSVFKNPKMKK